METREKIITLEAKDKKELFNAVMRMIELAEKEVDRR